MKRHAHGVALLFGFLSAVGAASAVSAADHGQGIQWRKSYSDAARESARTNKPMLMQVTSTWCGACQSMFSQTLADPSIVEQVNSSFVPFQIDADRHGKLISALGVRAYPTTIVIDGDLKILARLAGFQGSTTFRDSLAAAARKSADRNAATAKADPAADRPVTLDRAADEFGDVGFVAALLRIIQGS